MPPQTNKKNASIEDKLEIETHKQFYVSPTMQIKPMKNFIQTGQQQLSESQQGDGALS